MARRKMDLDKRANTLKENKLILCELRSRNKIDNKSLHDLNKLIGKFNAKNNMKYSKNSGANIGTKQENYTEDQYGPIDGFPPGSWWGIRMDCSRDRIHKPFNEDIQDGPFGVVSLCTSNSNANNDIDLGDYLTFTAEDCINDAQGTHPLFKNYRNQLPLRLIRSYNLTNDYAPKTGYRYDGLYRVVACWIGVNSKTEKNYKFALARLPRQDPPIWQLSRDHSVSGSNGRKFQPSVVEKLTDGNSDIAKDYDELARNADSRSLMNKLSLKKINVSSHESGIVTRCISKKTDGQYCGNMISVPYAETSLSSNNRLFYDNSSKSAICKLQNTNISIRTDLYDSSNIIQQETRKTTPMTFCRTYKNSRLPGRAINHSNVVSLNLNSCGPCPRDNIQESLIQSRSGNGKFSNDQSSNSDTNIDQSIFKSGSIVNEEFQTSIDDKRNSSIDDSMTKTVVDSIETTQKNILDNEEISGNESMKKILNVETKIINDISENVDKKRKSAEIFDDKSNNDEIERISNESHTDLESFTPDQMLNFIVKQKYHPTAKLLIGSVIGLATGESTILRAYESLISRKNHWSYEKNLINDEKELLRKSNENSSLDNSLDYNREKNVSIEGCEKERKVSKILPANRILKENKDCLMRKMNLRRTRRVSKRLMGSEKKSNSTNVRTTGNSQRLRKTNLTVVKSQQAFSKSTMLKKSKKSTKKRRGELANLVIDAKIGPISRGPRNRRLRCRTHIFGKKRYGNKENVTNRRNEKSREITRGGKKEITRVDLSTRKSRVSGIKSQISESRFADTSKIIRGNEINYNNDNNRTKIRKIRHVDTSKRIRGKGVKRKLTGNKNMNIKRVKMTDAATQCTTLRRDVTTCTDREIIDSLESENHLNPIKIEWIDVDDVKSEIYDNNDDSEQSIYEWSNESQNDYQARRMSKIQRNAETTTRTDETLISDKLSAFVPVNTCDSDFRIARLRSIGFKPIRSAIFSHDDGQSSNDYDNYSSTSSNDVNFSNSTAVASREVDELFNKYTNEETVTVGYMDHELCYEDIENEEIARARKNTNVYGTTTKKGRIVTTTVTESDKNETTSSEGVSSNEEDNEIPWHGWKKFVTNKQAQWIGW